MGLLFKCLLATLFCLPLRDEGGGGKRREKERVKEEGKERGKRRGKGGVYGKFIVNIVSGFWNRK